MTALRVQLRTTAHDATEHPDGTITCGCGTVARSRSELARAHSRSRQVMPAVIEVLPADDTPPPAPAPAPAPAPVLTGAPRREVADLEREWELPGFVDQAKRVHADFRIDVHTAGQLTAVLTAIGGHNDYDPHVAAAVLGPLVADAMRVEVEHFTAGPAIYIQVPFTHGQMIRNRGGAAGTRLTDDERQAFATRIILAGTTLRADEITTRQSCSQEIVRQAPGDRPYEIRLWWD